jgi:ATP-dependent RNA helicase RhlB
MSGEHLTTTRFTEFDLPETLLKGISEAGFEYCTPIQALSLPVALRGQDVTGQAQTGTGKTAAFLIATYNRLLAAPVDPAEQGNAVRTLILAPTRELAIQIHEDAVLLAKHTGLRVAIAYGGTDYQKQRERIEAGTDVLIGTPGRIIDYFKQRVFRLDELEVLVLDEADRMFDLGFISDIRYLFRAMPKPEKRLNMLFSATLSLRVNELGYEHMNNPEAVKVENEKITSDRVKEWAYMPSNEDKIPLLLGLLKEAGETRSLVFVNTRHIAEKIQAWLESNHSKSGLLSGDVPQPKREKLLQRFKDGTINVLVATDVAARGLHIPDVSRVINFDLPQDAEDYVHRIGRTARVGASGLAISMACETYAVHLMDIENFVGHRIDIEQDYSDILLSDAINPGYIPKRQRGKRREDRPSSNRKPDRKPSRGSQNKSREAKVTRPPPGADASPDLSTSSAPPQASQPERAPIENPDQTASSGGDVGDPDATVTQAPAKQMQRERRRNGDAPAIG